MHRGLKKRGPGRSGVKEQVWRGHIERQAAGRLSIRAYCAQHGVSEPSFYAWRRELARRDRQASSSAKPPRRDSGRRFVALTLRHAAPTATRAAMEAPPLGGVELVHPRGHVLRIAPGCNRDLLTTVLAVLEQPSC